MQRTGDGKSQTTDSSTSPSEKLLTQEAALTCCIGIGIGGGNGVPTGRTDTESQLKLQQQRQYLSPAEQREKGS